MFTLLRAPLFLGDHSGDRAFSKTPLSCPTVRGGLSPPFLGGRGGEGQNAVPKKKNSRDFLRRGAVRGLILEVNTNQSAAAGAGLRVFGWLVCGNIPAAWTQVWRPQALESLQEFSFFPPNKLADGLRKSLPRVVRLIPKLPLCTPTLGLL